MELEHLADAVPPTGTVTLADLSHLRTQAGPGQPEVRTQFPLNGQMYEVVPEPPAETSLTAFGSIGEGEAELLQGIAGNGQSAADLADKNPVAAMKLAVLGMSHTERAIAFIQAVLLPDSKRRFAYYMKPPPEQVPADDGDPRRDPATGMRPTTDAEQAKHRQHQITLRQCLGVYQMLMGHYAGRPTEAPSSSQSSHGATGGTSTAGAQPEALIP